MERSGLCDGEDGGLIGGASLKVPDIVEIVNAANQEKKQATGDSLERYFSRSPDLTIRTCAQPAA